MNKVVKREDIVNALEAADVYETEDAIRENYSGRGMYGDACFGIIVDGMSHAFTFFTALGQVGTENDDYGDGEDSFLDSQKAYELACAGRTDSMGMSTIVYFPGWTLV